MYSNIFDTQENIMTHTCLTFMTMSHTCVTCVFVINKVYDIFRSKICSNVQLLVRFAYFAYFCVTLA